MAKFEGLLSKMAVALHNEGGVVDYKMVLGQQYISMLPFIGKRIQLKFEGKIRCKACGRPTKISFRGGFCFPCSQNLVQCDLCIIKPETCHFAAGTCRESRWGEAVCMRDHIVYLANSSGIKVGITKMGQGLTRWIDQGATQALPIFRVQSRYQSGLVEVVFKDHVSDRTDWRKMLRGIADPLNLISIREQLISKCEDEIKTLQQHFGEAAIMSLSEGRMLTINYPVQFYPKKVKSLNFDKISEINEVLQGIKGQYLIFDAGVLNVRKFSGYQVTMVL